MKWGYYILGCLIFIIGHYLLFWYQFEKGLGILYWVVEAIIIGLTVYLFYMLLWLPMEGQ